MNTYRKLMKSKSFSEALRILPYSVIDKLCFAILALYMLHPVLSWIKAEIFPGLFMDWRSLNRSVLVIGIVIILLVILKLRSEGKRLKPIEFLKDNPPLIFFGVFILLMLISTAINGFSDLTLFGRYYRGEGLVGYLSYIVYFLLAVIMQNERLRKALIYWFIGSSSLLELYTIINFYMKGTVRVKLGFDQYNHYGYYLCVAFAVGSMLILNSHKLWQKLLFSATTVLSCLALIINDTFGCQIAIFIGLIAIAVIYSVAKGSFKVKVILPVIAFVTSFVMAWFSSPLLSEMITDNGAQLLNDTSAISGGRDEAELSTGVSRIVLWENTCRYISERPVFGFGADGTGERLLVDSDGDNDRSHCEFLHYAVCFGIPAAIVYIAAVFLVYLRGLLHKRSLTDMNILGLCAAMFYLASSVIGNTMYTTAPLLFIFLGLGYWVSSSEKESEVKNI